MSPDPTLLTQQAAAAGLRRLTMAEMRALAAVKANGTISGAAEMLRVAQPTLSQHIRDAEEKLGLALFTRHRRGIEPTPAGAVLLRLASSLQTDILSAAEELAMAAREDRRPLRIGSMAVTSGGLVAVALGRYAAETGTPAAVLVEGARAPLIEQLRRGQIDLFVGRLPPDDAPADLQQEVLMLDAAVAITATRHPLARRSHISTKALAAQSWILPAEDTAFHEQIDRTFRHAGLQVPRARVVSYSMLAIPAVVAMSTLVGFLPASLFGAGTVSAGLHRLDVDLDWVPSPVGMLMRPDPAALERMQGFLRILRAVAASARAAVAVQA
jgi:DNA-binding transcriptional LysR family regulator